MVELKGVIPAITTPFGEDRSLDLDGFRELVDLVDGTDIGVIQRRRCLCLANEPCLDLLLAEQMRRQKLQRDAAAELRVLGLVDNAHAAFADLLDDPVMRDPTAGPRGPR